MASVSHKVDDNGDHYIGVTVDGQFVPFARRTAEEVEILAAQEKLDEKFGKTKTEKEEE